MISDVWVPGLQEHSKCAGSNKVAVPVAITTLSFVPLRVA